MDIDTTILQHHYHQAGWGDLIANGSDEAFQMHNLYICDYSNGSMRILQTPFATMEELPNLHPSMVVGMAVECLKNINHDTSKKSMSDTVSSAFCYFKNTQGFKLWRNSVSGEQRLHGLINVYPCRHSDDRLLRPGVANSPDLIMGVSDVLSLSKEILAADNRAHPEWFKSVKLTPPSQI